MVAGSIPAGCATQTTLETAWIKALLAVPSKTQLCTAMLQTAKYCLLSGYLRVTGLRMRKANTAISELKINGVTRYRVTYPTATGRKRELYVDKKKAEKRLAEIKAEQKQFGLSVTAMTSTTRADAAAAEKILAGTGLTLVEIARAAVEQQRKAQSGIPVAEAIEAFTESRSGMSGDYLATLKSRATYISNFFAGRTTSSITAADCQRMLDGLAGTSSPGTVRHYRTQLSMLFTFCESRGWITGNPAKKTTKVKVTSQEAAILTPQEATTLLSACHGRAIFIL